MTHELSIKITGEVQNVGFRYQANTLAQELNLKGYVRNAEDGSVEIVAQGEKKNLQKLLSWARLGPRFARVEKLSFNWRKPNEKFSDFAIRR